MHAEIIFKSQGSVPVYPLQGSVYPPPGYSSYNDAGGPPPGYPAQPPPYPGPPLGGDGAAPAYPTKQPPYNPSVP